MSWRGGSISQEEIFQLLALVTVFSSVPLAFRTMGGANEIEQGMFKSQL